MTDRKHLSGREFEQLLEAVKGSRNETRDRYLVLLMGASPPPTRCEGTKSAPSRPGWWSGLA